MSDFHLLYWHWLVFGMVLVIAELFIPSFTIFWFGLGAMLTAAFLFFAPALSISWQLFIWAISSIVFTFVWFKYLRKLSPDRTRAGMAREAAIGATGMVIEVNPEGAKGTVRFSTPLLGADEWPFICEAGTSTGERVMVREISGNTLIVENKGSGVG